MPLCSSNKCSRPSSSIFIYKSAHNGLQMSLKPIPDLKVHSSFKNRPVAILSAGAIFTFLSISFLPSTPQCFSGPSVCALTFHSRPLTLFPPAFFIPPVSSVFRLSFLSIYVLSLFDVLHFSLSNTRNKQYF